MLNRICLEIFELLLLQSTDVCQGSLLFLSNGMEGSCTACHAWSIWTMVWKSNDECPKDEDMKLPLTDPSREWYHFTRVAIYLDPGVWMNFNPWSWEDGLLVRRPWLPLALHDGICVYIYTHFHILYLYIYINVYIILKQFKGAFCSPKQIWHVLCTILGKKWASNFDLNKTKATPQG